MKINEKFEILGFDESLVLNMITNIDNCKQNKNFATSYIVE